MIVPTRVIDDRTVNARPPLAAPGYAVVALVPLDAPPQHARGALLAALSVLWLEPDGTAPQLVVDTRVELGGAAPAAVARRRRRVPHLAELAGLLGAALGGRIVVSWDASGACSALLAALCRGEPTGILDADALCEMLGLLPGASLERACRAFGLPVPHGEGAAEVALATARLFEMATRRAPCARLPRAHNDDADQVQARAAV